MAKIRWFRPLAYTAAILTASSLATAAVAQDWAAGRQQGPVMVTVAMVGLGLLLAAYGIVGERRTILAYLQQRAEVKRRLARRKHARRSRADHGPVLELPAFTRAMEFSLRGW